LSNEISSIAHYHTTRNRFAPRPGGHTGLATIIIYARYGLIEHIFTARYTSHVIGPTKKITVNVPEQILKNAMALTGEGITPTIVRGLKEIERCEKRSALRKLRGRVRFELNLEETRS